MRRERLREVSLSLSGLSLRYVQGKKQSHHSEEIKIEVCDTQVTHTFSCDSGEVHPNNGDEFHLDEPLNKNKLQHSFEQVTLI